LKHSEIRLLSDSSNINSFIFFVLLIRFFRFVTEIRTWCCVHSGTTQTVGCRLSV
jgi:hypothetical protein